MWKPFVHDETNYLIRFDQSDDGVKILLSDLRRLWLLEDTRLGFINSFKESNPLFGGTDDEVFTEAVNAFKNLNTVNSLKFFESRCCLEIGGKIADLPIRMKCDFNLGSDETFYEEVTVPLVKTVQFLELKKNKMGEQLVAKDKEILEYNLQFGEISRKNIITSKYEKETDDQIDGLLLNVLTKADNFYGNFGKQHGDILQTFPELKELKVEKKKLTLPKAKKRKLR